MPPTHDDDDDSHPRPEDPHSIPCPVCGIGTMWIAHSAEGWFYRCDHCGTVAFP